MSFFPPSKVIEINLEHYVRVEEKGKFNDIAKQTKISEKKLILESGYSNFGFDPQKKTFSIEVAFTKDPSVVIKPISLSVNIFSTLKKIY